MSQLATRPVFLLSIDGGGVLGLMALHALTYIEKEMQRPISSLFDAIAGVSVGGIIALGLTTPDSNKSSPAYSAQQLSSLFIDNARHIFQRRPIQRLAHRLPLLGLLDYLFFSKYSAQPARTLYKQWFNNCALSHALTQTIIPAYNISGSIAKGPRIKIFDSWEILEKKGKSLESRDFPMHDIALATSAAPTYFPPHRMHHLNGQHQSIQSNDYFIDGGVAINDPTVLAYARLRKRYPHSPIHTVSLGVGTSNHVYGNILKHSAPGALPWALKIGDLLVSPQLSVYKKLLHHLQKGAPPPGGYWRIQSLSPSDRSRLDDTSHQNFNTIMRTSHKMLVHHQHDLTAILYYLRQKHSS
jgi:patatin-like phospholipase/acyl hydrolase